MIHAKAEQSTKSERGVKKGLIMGLVSGIVAISCCVSPIVLVLIGVATAAEAVTLGDTLYYTYGWAFRGAGLIAAIAAVVLYLRGRNACNINGARTHWRTLLTLVIVGGATYAGLFWLTKYLGIWFG
ncbi:MAG: hypothetical protein O2854_04250 [Chloroflexi bacterium]|nr:hypothetical protein [Chloroflexota bacterium]